MGHLFIYVRNKLVKLANGFGETSFWVCEADSGYWLLSSDRGCRCQLELQRGITGWRGNYIFKVSLVWSLRMERLGELHVWPEWGRARATIWQLIVFPASHNLSIVFLAIKPRVTIVLLSTLIMGLVLSDVFNIWLNYQSRILLILKFKKPRHWNIFFLLNLPFILKDSTFCFDVVLTWAADKSYLIETTNKKLTQPRKFQLELCSFKWAAAELAGPSGGLAPSLPSPHVNL